MIEALDLFAGTGWGVACQRLGIDEYGVEINPDAVATRAEAGMTTAYNDVWHGLMSPDDVPPHHLEIASPPCQTFSAAGNGAGRRALGDVLGAIERERYLSPSSLKALDAELDPRTSLVLTPLAYAVRHLPEFIAWEQVPAVLPVWEACANVLRQLSYSVAVGVVSAERYGVPQTRKRAILVARLWGEVTLPQETHEAFGSTGSNLLATPTLGPALGWDAPEHPVGIVGNQRPGGGEFYITRSRDEPAMTVTGVANKFKLHHGGKVTRLAGLTGLREHEAAALQTYPEGFPFQGGKVSRFLQIGNAVPPTLAEAILSSVLGVSM